MSGHGSKLNRKMEQAILGLMTTRTHEEAARFAGIGIATLTRWLDIPEFDAAFRKANAGPSTNRFPGCNRHQALQRPR